jgi:murein tripeptide amidase MpaA
MKTKITNTRPIILLLALVFMISPTFPQDLGDHDVISVVKTPAILKFLQREHFDLLMERDGRLYAVVGVKDLMRLSRTAIPYTIETMNFPPYSEPYAQRMSVQGGLNGDFHSYWETEQELMALEQSHPERAALHILGQSLEGRNIYALKISDQAASDEPEAEILFLGCHHAREWISVEVPLLLARHLLEQYTADENVKALVDNAEIWIVPIVNPDGLEYSIHVYRYWRKNRRLNADGSYGVDPNRNYGYQWGLDDEGSSPDPSSAVYRGTGPFSEPETQIVRDLVEQREFRALISYHNYTQIIIYPWGYTDEPAPDSDLLGALAQNMAIRMEPVNGRWYIPGPASGLYHTNGDTTDWAYGTHGIPSFTIELPPPSQAQGGFFNAEEDIQPIFAENLPAALYLIDWAIQQNSGGNSSEKVLGSASSRHEQSVKIRQQNKR